MPLTLSIRNARQLDNGSPVTLVLDQRGAMIGRASTNDWCLPDPSRHVSSRHCEVRYSEGGYELIDHSTNGTFLEGQGARLSGPHAIAPGDVFVVGPFEIAAALDGAAAAAASARGASPPPPEWKGWAAAGAVEAAPPTAPSAWDARPSGSAISGTGPMSSSWAPPGTGGAWGVPPETPPAAAPAPVPPASAAWGAPPAQQPAPHDASAWTSPPPPPAPASAWSSPPTAPSTPGAEDVWGKFSQSNVVDWARGGFGQTAPAQAPVAAPNAPQIATASPHNADGAPFAAESQPVIPQASTSAAPPPVGNAALQDFAAVMGLTPDRFAMGERETVRMAGNLLRRLVAGMVVMLEARARAKSQLGTQSTSLEFDGNNPLKFARTPEQALAQLLNVPERGFMGSEQAIEDAFKDLQAHQMATLSAMQGALRATLDRFSPRAIRARAESGGLLAKILPGAKEAALWASYEREFSGVAQGSDEAFMDIFAKEFKRAYEEMARKR